MQKKLLKGRFLKMKKGAMSQELKTAIEDHLQVTQGQITRLEQVFATLEEKQRKKCEAMKGPIKEPKAL